MVAQHVTVSGINMQLGEALVEQVQEHMAALSNKYFGKLVTCRVAFTKNEKRHSFTCNIQVTVGRDLHFASEAVWDNPQISFKQAYEHVAKQLRRQKRAKHEDKPNGHLKELVLNELSRPEREEDVLPIDGEELSILDGENGSEVVQKLFGH